MIDYVNTDLIVLDLHLQMPKDGINITTIIDERGGPSYIFITANADMLIVQEAIQTKAENQYSSPRQKSLFPEHIATKSVNTSRMGIDR